ncbi:hypothetical protein N7541_000692 [Penicillium brevicompactum]|uniref:BTB domain-containing protein n=1 Tax=Penicillium brevicompactum TaxID=5074 RepID=A0A9W9RUU8_PENBR|nr:hypothetical protein N7541_000692 [Penicillium brevicompactum]
MAYRPMKEVLESPLFTFEVGPQKKEFVVHSLIIAKLSPALNALINGEWKEGSDKRVDWSEVKEGTFLRLCEFAYGKDYTLPAPDLGGLSFPKTTHATTSGASNDDDKNSNGESACSTFEVDDDMHPDKLGWPHFPSCDFFYLKKLDRWGLANAHPNPDWDKSLWGGANGGNKRDFSSALIEQVEIYVLADKWGVEQLCRLVVFRTYGLLNLFTKGEVALEGTIEFVMFVYENTPPSPTNHMRKLAARYLFEVAPSLSECGSFHELMKRGGDVVMDLWQMMLRHQPGPMKRPVERPSETDSERQRWGDVW